MSQSTDDPIRIITDDKTHFPMIEIENMCFLTLWPITKIQFEIFMSEVNQYGDKWYDELLSCNPRISYNQANKDNYEQLFITGVHIKETLPFSKWFGEEFRIPTVKEWRNAYKIVSNLSDFKKPLDLSYPANEIWKKVSKFSKHPIEISMMQKGLIEWVKDGKKDVGIGAPKSTTLNPHSDLVEILNRNERLKDLGFRLIKGGDYE
jgi:hypothetical protein